MIQSINIALFLSSYLVVALSKECEDLNYNKLELENMYMRTNGILKQGGNYDNIKVRSLYFYITSSICVESEQTCKSFSSIKKEKNIVEKCFFLY